MEYIADHQRCKKSEDHLFLQRQVDMKMATSGSKDEQVDQSDQGADVTKLDYSN